MAKSAPARATWMKRPIFFSSFFSIQRNGSKFFTSPRDGAVEAGGIKERDGADAAFAGDEIFPTFVGADAQRADQSNARYNYTASQVIRAPCMR